MPAAPKAQQRRHLLAARRAVAESVRQAESEQLCGHLDRAVDGAATVCAYWPVGTEPGSPALLERLSELCDSVLLPISRVGPDGTHLGLDWGTYRPGQLVEARFGLKEPAGPALGEDAVARADVMLVPALAVDRGGVRLGRGGGFYDRSLRRCRTGTRLIAVVRDTELLGAGAVPREPHDVLMTHALTPGAGLIALEPSAPTR